MSIRPSVLIVGYTGAGKTSLLQSLFGAGLVPDDRIGHGKPTTSHFVLYESDAIRIYDSQGLETGAGQEQDFVTGVSQHMASLRDDPNVANHLHLVWYCIDGSRARVTPCDLRLIRGLAKHVIVLITKSDITREPQFQAILDVLRREGVDPDNVLPCSIYDADRLAAIRKRTLELAPAAYRTALRGSMKLVPVQTFAQHKKRVWSVAFSPDSRYLASGGKDNKVVIRHIAEKSLTGQFCVLPATNDVNCVRFSPDGRFLAYGDDDGKVWLRVLTRMKQGSPGSGGDSCLYDLDRLVQSLDDECTSAALLDYCYSVAFHPTKPWLAAGTKAKAAVVFAYECDPQSRSLKMHRKWTFETANDVNSVVFASDGETLLFVDDDGRLHMAHLTEAPWGLEQTPSFVSFDISGDYIRTLDAHPTKPVVAAAGDDNTIRVYECGDRVELLASLNRNDEIWSVRFSPCGELLVFGDGDGMVGIWEWGSNKMIAERLHNRRDDHVYAVDMSPDGRFIATGSWDNTVRLWPMPTI